MTRSHIERIAAGRTDCVIDHLDSGGAADAVDASRTPLAVWCAYYGDVAALRLLLARGVALDVLGPDLGLDAAAFHGHWRLCQFLLERGAPVNGVASATGETPLHAALCSDDRVVHDAVVDVLLTAGANPNAATRPGVPTGSFMRDCRTRAETPLHRAAAFGTVATIRRLIDAGARTDARDMHGDTPLSWASWYRRPPDVLRTLLHGEHALHPGYAGMRANLVGNPDAARSE